ncbi:methyltransferase domain-containing protein [Haloferax sp. MBLA0076]|uniref:Methyltransferase domain-containing protein n=1 Tax=Haloferax litoreum TaxID=2666140 RepID=A0A6A8GJT5_9EURY|nr:MULTISPECIES: class I SAM-dependent methyltransferase [Haloferax]KAB1193798.1 class I SAM-dependent methyltransferase [Haloferax sp. CBA1148]MRX22337.1 methyltransferase domain-containing protein [Haloferax litoreum]
MDVPTTVRAALEDRPVSGAICLEAGAGVGNTTAGLLAAGASRVYAVTTNPDHASLVRERVAPDDTDRTAVLEADVRTLPLADSSVEIITAHGLFNLLAPETLDAVVSELTRVAAPGCHLVVDDYDPLPETAAVCDLFALENAVSELANGTPALTFYPAGVLRRSFVAAGWEFDRERTLLDPVPWTKKHLRAHANATKSLASKLSPELADPLTEEVEHLRRAIGDESVGQMFSLAFRRR